MDFPDLRLADMSWFLHLQYSGSASGWPGGMSGYVDAEQRPVYRERVGTAMPGERGVELRGPTLVRPPGAQQITARATHS